MVAGDKLVFNGMNLEDQDKLFQHGITQDSELLLSREDSSRALIYECGGTEMVILLLTLTQSALDCGTDIRLKRHEPIRCRFCGCRIVYKKRTTRRNCILSIELFLTISSACQYVAR